MKAIMKSGLLMSLTATAATLLSGCNHKDLVYDTTLRNEVEVVFDWRNAPDANPASMELRLHPSDNPEDVVNFIFRNQTGGPLDAPVGNYTAVALNADLTDWAQTRYSEDPDRFTIYTPDAESLQQSGISTRAIPRAQGSEDERLAQTPGMAWGDRIDNVSIHSYSGRQVITMYPEELVCHYTVDILNVDHLQYLHGSDVDASLTGMAEGVYVGKNSSTEQPVTMMFTLSPQAESNSLHGEFLTFGEPDSDRMPHTLSFYLILNDGTRWHFTSDVAQQIYNAADPRHVHIIVSDVSIPAPINAGTGIIPDVDEWESVNIDLKM